MPENPDTPNVPPISDPPEVRLERIEQMLERLGDVDQLRADIAALKARVPDTSPPPPSLTDEPRRRFAQGPPPVTGRRRERQGRSGDRLGEHDESQRHG